MAALTYEAFTETVINIIQSYSDQIGVPVEQIIEAGASLDFNVPAPFIYVHFDISGASVETGFQVKIMTDIFVLAEGKETAAEAKKEAMKILRKVMLLFLEKEPELMMTIPKNEDFIEIFSEYSNKAILKLTLTSDIEMFHNRNFI